MDGYVSVVEIVKDFLVHGYPRDESRDRFLDDDEVGCISKSPAGWQIFETGKHNHMLGGNSAAPLTILWITEWSDDFDPNNTKDNRGSVWIKDCLRCCMVSQRA